ncbi:MAG: carbon-nitrogen hydrolase family protein [Deltaproteobacteria bacterium]|nr:carbon-nitrogen hydrolase family protein [Deltaproteobacteria bacterium]
MKVTVCELRNELDDFKQDWQSLVAHVRSESSELVLLPEMPFYPWLAKTRPVDPGAWEASVEAHDQWILRLNELSAEMVVSSRPVIRHGRRFNEGFIWDTTTDYRAMHTKYYLPDEEGFWEASWYERGECDFSIGQKNKTRIGFLICTDLWFNFHAREYAKQGIHLLVCPRATPATSVGKWISGGRTAAVVSGAFCLSSNFSGVISDKMNWGGNGWIIEPEEGEVLGVTSQQEPFLTMDVNLEVAEVAKNTYPRYVPD